MSPKTPTTALSHHTTDAIYYREKNSSPRS